MARPKFVCLTLVSLAASILALVSPPAVAQIGCVDGCGVPRPPSSCLDRWEGSGLLAVVACLEREGVAGTDEACADEGCGAPWDDRCRITIVWAQVCRQYAGCSTWAREPPSDPNTCPDAAHPYVATTVPLLACATLEDVQRCVRKCERNPLRCATPSAVVVPGA